VYACSLCSNQATFHTVGVDEFSSVVKLPKYFNISASAAATMTTNFHDMLGIFLWSKQFDSWLADSTKTIASLQLN
jgi:hypothetical protein